MNPQGKLKHLPIVDISFIEKDLKPGSFTTYNKKKDKEGLFRFPPTAFTLEGEESLSFAAFQRITPILDMLPEYVGKTSSYKCQGDSIDDGILGIIHWYIGQWIKSGTITTIGGEDILFKAIYKIHDKELFISSFFRLLTRSQGFAQYAILGQIIDTYILWLLSIKNGNTEEATKLSSLLFGLGYEMSKAEYEGKIIAGKSRTSDATKEKTKKAEEQKQRVISTIQIVIAEIKRERPNARKITRAQIIRKLARKFGHSESTIKRYLKDISIEG